MKNNNTSLRLTSVKSTRTATSSFKKNIKKALNADLFVQQATPLVKRETPTTILFENLTLHPYLKNNIRKMGFVSTTEIQDKTIEALINGENLIGIASTGTGKTGAFLIPILERILNRSEEKQQALVIVPTRELAQQVLQEFNKLTVGLSVKANCFIGGTNVEKDVQSCKRFVDITIGTPGRLVDLADRGALKFGPIETLVLDEFDKMLDMGFMRDVRYLVQKMENRKQTILFSATKATNQDAVIRELIHNPVLVEVTSGDASSKNVDQKIIRVKDGQDKYPLLLNLLNDSDFDKVILFTDTKHLADKLAKKLTTSGITTDQIHGNKSQNYRTNALHKFKKGNIRVLVATDVLARGIDVNNVSLVINYQAPTDMDTYIHRVGRTGRAGKTGTAYTFVD